MAVTALQELGGDIMITQETAIRATTKGNTMAKVMVRSTNAGVFYGKLVSRDGDTVVLKDSRRVWYWAGAATLSELANRGTSKPEECTSASRSG